MHDKFLLYYIVSTTRETYSVKDFDDAGLLRLRTITLEEKSEIESMNEIKTRIGFETCFLVFLEKFSCKETISFLF